MRISPTPRGALRDADVVRTTVHDGPAAWNAREQQLLFFDAPVLGTREPAEAGSRLKPRPPAR